MLSKEYFDFYKKFDEMLILFLHEASWACIDSDGNEDPLNTESRMICDPEIVSIMKECWRFSGCSVEYNSEKSFFSLWKKNKIAMKSFDKQTEIPESFVVDTISFLYRLRFKINFPEKDDIKKMNIIDCSVFDSKFYRKYTDLVSKYISAFYSRFTYRNEMDNVLRLIKKSVDPNDHAMMTDHIDDLFETIKKVLEYESKRKESL